MVSLGILNSLSNLYTFHRKSLLTFVGVPRHCVESKRAQEYSAGETMAMGNCRAITIRIPNENYSFPRLSCTPFSL